MIEVHGGIPTFFLLEALVHRFGIAGMKPLESFTIEIPPYAYLDLLEKPTVYLNAMPEEFVPLDQAEKKAWYQAIVGIFSNLKHLVLLCSGPSDTGDGTMWGGSGSEWQAKMFLETATNLQSLELEMGNGVRIPTQPDFTELQDLPMHAALMWLMSRRETTYPHLKELKVGATFKPKFFINFLSHHKSTLRSLEMKDCVSHNWREVLAFIKHDLKLAHFSAKFLWTRRVTRKGTNERDWLFFDQALNEEVGLSLREIADRIPDFGTRRWMRWEGKLEGYDQYIEDDHYESQDPLGLFAHEDALDDIMYRAYI